MTDSQKFKHILEYVIAHLYYVTGKNPVGYDEYIKPFVDRGKKVFKKSGQGYAGYKIQKQIEKWQDIYGTQLCITINATNYYNSKINYVNWKDTAVNVVPVWANGGIAAFKLVYYEDKPIKKWTDLSNPVSITDLGLFDGNYPNQVISDFLSDFERQYDIHG